MQSGTERDEGWQSKGKRQSNWREGGRGKGGREREREREREWEGEGRWRKLSRVAMVEGWERKSSWCKGL